MWVIEQIILNYPSIGALCNFFTWLLPREKITFNLAIVAIILAEVILWTNNEWKIVNNSSQWWVMDGKEESLGTDGNSFLGLHGHHIRNGEPPSKAGTFLAVWRRLKLIKKIVHFSVSQLMSNSDRMVFLHLKHKDPLLLGSIAS